jgi:hypothetical protein
LLAFAGFKSCCDLHLHDPTFSTPIRRHTQRQPLHFLLPNKHISELFRIETPPIEVKNQAGYLHHPRHSFFSPLRRPPINLATFAVVQPYNLEEEPYLAGTGLCQGYKAQT